MNKFNNITDCSLVVKCSKDIAYVCQLIGISVQHSYNIITVIKFSRL